MVLAGTRSWVGGFCDLDSRDVAAVSGSGIRLAKVTITFCLDIFWHMLSSSLISDRDGGFDCL